MASVKKNHIHSHQNHLVWDNSIPPILTISSGETVSFSCLDASNGQVTANSTVQAIKDFKMDLLDQVNGPIFVEGAEPGDVLEIEFLSVSTADWGWTGIIPDFGLLADHFPEPCLKIWSIDRQAKRARFNDRISIPTDRPFCGEVGLAMAKPGAFSTIPPSRVGGNLDMRHIEAGSRLFLPVEVTGALLSLGDGHAAQGDGEVCGTAIETPLEVTVRCTVHKHDTKPYLDTPHAETRTGLRNSDRGYYIVTGVETDLLRATRSAVLDMIKYLVAEHAVSREEAYMLCSVAAELKIACCVDMPQYVVGCYLPLDIFDAQS